MTNILFQFVPRHNDNVEFVVSILVFFFSTAVIHEIKKASGDQFNVIENIKRGCNSLKSGLKRITLLMVQCWNALSLNNQKDFFDKYEDLIDSDIEEWNLWTHDDKSKTCYALLNLFMPNFVLKGTLDN
ncbi:MAG: hypothetical protein GY714_14210 [Desulfobacterales bacterium]|nr:hypothetical protein [Desulfobacterales bacterium]